MMLTLTPDLEQALAAEARKLGIPPEQLALDSLRERFMPSEAAVSLATGETLADFLREDIGVLHSSEYIPGGARMSEDSGKKFAAVLVALRQKGQR